MGQPVDEAADAAEQAEPMSAEDEAKYAVGTPTLDADQLAVLAKKTFEDMYTSNFAAGSVELRRRCAKATSEECPPLIASSDK